MVINRNRFIISIAAIMFVSNIHANERLDRFEPGMAKFSRCILKIEGIAYINGPCIGRIDSYGFQINSSKYFAVVNLDGNNQAVGYWNEEAYAGHAHSDLGVLMREGACWKNSSAIVCAWK